MPQNFNDFLMVTKYFNIIAVNEGYESFNVKMAGERITAYQSFELQYIQRQIVILIFIII